MAQYILGLEFNIPAQLQKYHPIQSDGIFTTTVGSALGSYSYEPYLDLNDKYRFSICVSALQTGIKYTLPDFYTYYGSGKKYFSRGDASISYLVKIRKSFERVNYIYLRENRYLIAGHPFMMAGAGIITDDWNYYNEIKMNTFYSYVNGKYQKNDIIYQTKNTRPVSPVLQIGGGFQFQHKNKNRFTVSTYYQQGFLTFKEVRLQYFEDGKLISTPSFGYRGSCFSISIGYSFDLYRHKKKSPVPSNPDYAL